DVGGNTCFPDAEVRVRPNPNGGNWVTLHGRADIYPGYNPSWIDAAIDGDLAVVTLTDGTAPYYAAPFVVAEDTPPIDSIVGLAGYGLTGGDCTGNDESEHPTLNRDTTDVDDYQNGHDIMEFDDEVYCHGDSGGPVFGDGERQYAV